VHRASALRQRFCFDRVWRAARASVLIPTATCLIVLAAVGQRGRVYFRLRRSAKLCNKALREIESGVSVHTTPGAPRKPP
jgi:hypothetical protein